MFKCDLPIWTMAGTFPGAIYAELAVLDSNHHRRWPRRKSHLPTYCRHRSTADTQILAILFFIIRGLYRCCTGTSGKRRQPRRSRMRNTGPLPPPPMRQSGLAPPPPAQGRHSGSVNSTDPINTPQPPPEAYRGSQHGWAYSNNPPPPSYGGNNGWVDPGAYNGPEYGRGGGYR